MKSEKIKVAKALLSKTNKAQQAHYLILKYSYKNQDNMVLQ